MAALAAAAVRDKRRRQATADLLSRRPRPIENDAQTLDGFRLPDSPRSSASWYEYREKLAEVRKKSVIKAELAQHSHRSSHAFADGRGGALGWHNRWLVRLRDGLTK